jgi:phosphomannomutase
MTTTPDDLLDRAKAWLAEDPDPETRAELSALIDAGDTAELADRFSGFLEFGTAGLRGALGAGPNRMNRVVVLRAAAGLAAYLRERGAAGNDGDSDGTASVVIGYDARKNSHVFATDTAEVMTGAGLRAYLLPGPLPTPVLAYAIRKLGCVAGVTVTASHNPPQDNGYKVYLGDGSQIVPPADADISAAIAAVGPLAQIPRGTGWTVLGEEMVSQYLDRVATLPAPGGPRELTIAYTPMHGVGGAVVVRALARTGFAAPAVVQEQAEPDPAFPTVAFPNPEEPGALDLAFALASKVGADVVLANDPDADRLAVAVPQPGADGAWRRLTGDEVGVLLATHLIRSGVPGTLACSIVSSSQLAAIAERNGRAFVQTLTGFKWIGRIPGLAFGYEEALGYCVDPAAVGDKDGISALVRMAELAAALKADGRTLLDRLDEIALEYGVYATEQISTRLDDLDQATAVISRLREAPPTALGGRIVERFDDLAAPADELPPTDGVRYYLADRGRVIVRPSGTEPKLKCYLEVVEPVVDGRLEAARTAARTALAEIRGDLDGLLQP